MNGMEGWKGTIRCIKLRSWNSKSVCTKKSVNVSVVCDQRNVIIVVVYYGTKMMCAKVHETGGIYHNAFVLAVQLCA